MPHFHIPLQSGCDSVLRRMGRRYTTEFFANKIAHVRSLMPHAFIGIDVIAGFPGETDNDFEQTMRFLENVRPSYLHIFPYSQRDKTAAAVMEDQVSMLIKSQRMTRLEALNGQLHSEFIDNERKFEHSVLIEMRSQLTHKLVGYTENYVRMEVCGGDDLINTIVHTHGE